MEIYRVEALKVDRRRVEPGEKKSYEITQLWDRNREILRLLSIGWSPKQISARLGVTEQTVSNTRNSKLGQKHLAIMRAKRDEQVFDAQAKIEELVPLCYQTYQEILESEGISTLKKQTADTLLKDLAGHAVPKQFELRQASYIHKRIETIKRNAEASKKAMIDAGVIVEAEFTEEVKDE